jgi:hypothetical protein
MFWASRVDWHVHMLPMCVAAIAWWLRPVELRALGDKLCAPFGRHVVCRLDIIKCCLFVSILTHVAAAAAACCVLSVEPRTFGEELCAALLCQPPAAPAAAAPAPALPPAVAPFTPPGFSPQGLGSPAGTLSPQSTGGGAAGSNAAGSGSATAAPGQLLDLQLQAGRAARVLGFLLHHNPAGQHRLLVLQVNEAPGDMLLGRCVRLLSECARRGDGAARQVCCSVLRMLVEWCAGCEPAVAALLAPPSHLPLLVDLVGGRVPGGDAHTAGAHMLSLVLDSTQRFES